MSEDKAKNLLNQLSTIHVTQPCLVSGRMSFLWICPVLKKQWLMSCRLLHVQRLWDVSLPGFFLSSLLSLLKTECQLHSLSSSRNFNSHFFHFSLFLFCNSSISLTIHIWRTVDFHLGIFTQSWECFNLDPIMYLWPILFSSLNRQQHYHDATIYNQYQAWLTLVCACEQYWIEFKQELNTANSGPETTPLSLHFRHCTASHLFIHSEQTIFHKKHYYVRNPLYLDCQQKACYKDEGKGKAIQQC